jgi:DNA ligase-4
MEGVTKADLSRYPEKPVNHAKTLPFHELFISLFDLLHANNKKPASAGRGGSRAKQGPHGPNNLTPHQRRDNIIQRFMSRWRQDVGNDFFPALRLILPEKDKDRAMYGIKEKAIAKLIVKMLKINPKSDDANYLLNWKVPGKNRTIAMAGDFAGRCYEVLVQRATRSQVGDMRIAEVNALLDKLSAVSKENEQLAIFETFYNRMNADELMWLIRIILRQMKVGASEKTILDVR